MPKQKRKHPRDGTLTPQQRIILALVLVMGSSILALAAFILFSAEPLLPAAALPAPSETMSLRSPLPATWTPAPAALQPLEPPNAPTPTPLSVPVDCARWGNELRQGVFSRVLDARSIEVQVDGAALPIQFTGISISNPETGGPAAPDPETITGRLEALLQNQPIVLVRDTNTVDTDGPLARYVFAGGRFINYELVRDGLAQVDSASTASACASFLNTAQEQARVEHAGVWAPTRVPTATFVPFVALDPEQNSCNCTKRYTCADFSSHEKAQACYNACNDYNSLLDEDRDGIACEGLK